MQVSMRNGKRRCNARRFAIAARPLRQILQKHGPVAHIMLACTSFPDIDMRQHAAIVLASTLFALASPAHAACTLSTQERDDLYRWKSSSFGMDNASARNQRALSLLDCLGDADPFLRDDIAFEALSTWMREKQLDTGTLRHIQKRLLAQLDETDDEGFKRPFAALVLSEIARTDRVQPWMTTEELRRMSAAAVIYLSSVRDYRGYANGEGWRHGVAHGADWAMQLMMNKSLQHTQALMLVSAVGSQVMPDDGHAYAFGEPARLARPVSSAVMRGSLTAPALEAWLEGLLASLGPRPSDTQQETWWKRRANLESFLHALANQVHGDTSLKLITLSQAVRSTISRLP